MNYTHASKNFTHVLVTSMPNKMLLKSRKSIKSLDTLGVRKSLFGVCRIKDTKVIGVYSRCSRNEVLNHDFFEEENLVSGYTNKYWDKITP